MEITDTGKRKRTTVKDWLIALGIPLIILLSWLTGGYFIVNGDAALAHKIIATNDMAVNQVNTSKWMVADSAGNTLGSAYLGKGNGYGGTILTLTYTNTLDTIISVEVISHSETHTYFKKLYENNFFDFLIGKHPETLAKHKTIDAVTGATISSLGVIEGIVDGYSKGEGVAYGSKYKTKFGSKEIAVILLLTLGLIIPNIKNAKQKIHLLWLAQVGALVTLGIWLNSSITLTQINALTHGYLPALAGGLFIVILIVASTTIPLFTGKNIYCTSVCPFGAAQRFIGLFGNPRTLRPSYYKWLKWAQWTAALTAISAAALARNATLTDYTIFGNFFRLNGSAIGIGAVIAVVILSLFINRPWCHFICPIDGVFAYIKHLRIFFRNQLKPLKHKQTN